MEPTIKTGEIAFVKPVPPKEIKKGDIITFLSPKDQKQTILHRVYKIKKDKSGYISFETKGDNNNAKDNWQVPSISLQGRYLFGIPAVGQIAAEMKKPLGFALMIGLPAIILIFLQIKSIIEGINEEVEKRTKKALKDIEEKKNQMQSLKTIVVMWALASFTLFTSGIKTLKAVYVSTANISGISFSVKDFIAPNAPILLSPEDNKFLNSVVLHQTWSIVEDTGNSIPVTYFYESCNTNPGKEACPSIRWTETFTISKKNCGYGAPFDCRILKNASGAPEGAVWWRVKAIDASGNESPWSEVWKFTIDNHAPTSSFKTPSASGNTLIDPYEISGTTEDNFGVEQTEIKFAFYNNSDPNHKFCESFDDPTHLIHTFSNSLKNSPFDWSFSWTPPDLTRAYCLKAQGTDLAGNKEHTAILENIIFSPKENAPTPTPTSTTLENTEDKLTPEEATNSGVTLTPTETPTPTPTEISTPEPTIINEKIEEIAE